MIYYPQVDRDSCCKCLSGDNVPDRRYSARFALSHQLIQFWHCLRWVSRKQFSKRLFQSLEIGLARSELDHLLSSDGSTLITARPLPTRILTTTSSRSLFGLRSL